jgi:hypothetical protein
MNFRRLTAIAAGTIFCTLAGACLGSAQNTSPAPTLPAPQPSAGASPTVPGRKLPLLIANYSSKHVDVYIGRGLKCSLPKGYKCNLEVPIGRYPIRFVREGGGVFEDSFQLPQFIAGKEYDGGAFVIKEDQVVFGAPVHK